MTVKINGAEVSNSALVVLLCATLTTLSSGTNCGHTGHISRTNDDSNAVSDEEK